MKIKMILFTVAVFFSTYKNIFPQTSQNRGIDNIFFLGEQKIDSPYVVTFLPSFESIIIQKND